MAVGNVKILWITTRVLFNVDTSNSTERFGLAVALTPTDPKGKEIQVTRWWQIGINELGNNLKTDVLRGLSEQEAKRRITEHGPNQLREKKGKHPFFLFLDQFKDFIIWVLIGAALVSGFLREWVDTVAILVIVILNAVMGFVQTYRAEKSLAALKRMSSPSTKVIRDDKRFMIWFPETSLKSRRGTMFPRTAGLPGTAPISRFRKPASRASPKPSRKRRRPYRRRRCRWGTGSTWPSWGLPS
jgi:hypothetical protein